MLLSEARTRVLALVDDADGARFDADGAHTAVDDALKTAQLEAWQAAVSAGSSTFVIETSISSGADGSVNLATLKPLKIVNLALSASGQRLTVPPCRLDEAPTNASGVRALSIAYVPRAAFPSAAGNAFVWASTALADASPLLDKLMCTLAASELKITTGDVNKALELRKAELREAISETLSQSSWSIMPLDGYADDRGTSGFEYVMTAPDTLQLVLA